MSQEGFFSEQMSNWLVVWFAPASDATTIVGIVNHCGGWVQLLLVS